MTGQGWRPASRHCVTALFWLWLLSTVVGYFATLNYANQPHDLVLLQRAQVLADTNDNYYHLCKY